MGLFKWHINFNLKTCKDTIACGYVLARSEEEAINKVKSIYINKFNKVHFNKYFTIEMEDDWDFSLINDNIISNDTDINIQYEAEIEFN